MWLRLLLFSVLCRIVDSIVSQFGFQIYSPQLVFISMTEKINKHV